MNHISLHEQDVRILGGENIAAPLPKLEYLVPDLGLVAGSGAAHMIAGYGFTGKTLAAQALALSLVSGSPLWGAFATPLRRVVHVDLEQGDRLTRCRYQRLARAMNIDLRSLGSSLAVAVMPRILLNPSDSDRWRKLMENRDLLILDSLRAATSGADENDSAIRAGLDMLSHISESTGCRVLMVHHARKPAIENAGARFSIRGSSAIFDACDSVFVFGGAKGEPVQVEHVKARSHGKLTGDFALTISDVELNTDPMAGLRVEAHSCDVISQKRSERVVAAKRALTVRNAEAVRQVIESRPGIGKVELKTMTSLSGPNLMDALSHLGNEVEVITERVGRNVTLRHYIKP